MSIFIRYTNHQLILIDAFGALLTSSLLYIVVFRYHEFFGLSPTIITVLIGAALLLTTFSGICYLFVRQKAALFLTIIATLNTLYCLATLSILIIYREDVSIWAMVYFLGEIAIVMILVTEEFRRIK
jgi:hypothetical protein